MSCQKSDPALLLHAHGQLGGLRRLLLDTHLRRCSSCRDRWTRSVMERDALRRALAPAPGFDPTADRLLNAVAVRIRTEPREPRVRPASRRTATLEWPRSAAVLVAVAVLLAIALSAMATFWAPSFRKAPNGVGPACPVLAAAGARAQGAGFRNIPPAANQACYRCHLDLNHPNLLRR